MTTPARRQPRPLAVLLGLATALGLILTAVLVSGGGPGQPAAAAALPVRAAFYYPWYPETEHWATRYTPTLGHYDSSDATVLASHVRSAKYAGLQAFISSYWGRSSKTAARLPQLLAAARAQSFSVTAYYEPESKSTPPSPTELRADFDALYAASADPAWLRVGGKPVLFVYNTGAEGSCAGISRLLTASAGRFYLNPKVFSGYRTCSQQPDGWHQYGPAVGYDQQGSDAASVSPGFYKFNEASPRLARDLTRFRNDLARQVASGTRWQLLTTFNEWGEGTSVESAAEWASPSGYGRYLDAMRAAYLPIATPSASVTPTPTATPTPSVTATPSTAPAGDPVIAAAGDVACTAGATPGSSCQHKAVSDKILADKALAAVLVLGDIQYESGQLSQFQTSYDPTWGRFKAKTRPVPGNHEYGTAGAAGYYDYFGSVAGDRTKGYYSYDIGAWHFLALNSEVDTGATGAQVAWLKADLATHPNRCVAAYWHKPRWSSGNHGDNSLVAPFVQALYDGGADLLLAGHDHDYERFVPLDPSGVPDAARGLTEIVSGTGGRSHYAAAGRSTTAAKDSTSYGYTRLVLHAGSADVRFVAAVGSFTDTTTVPCH